MAATSAASSSSPAKSGHDAKARARASRRAFEIRNRLRAGLEVSEADRAFASAYDSDPQRRKIRRQLPTPPVAAPTRPPVVAPPEQKSEASTPVADASGGLPPLRVDVADLAGVAASAPPVDARRAAAAETAARIIDKAKEMNAASFAAGAMCSLPPEVAELLFDEAIAPCLTGTIARHGGLKFTEKQEDWVTGGTAAALLIGAVEARELRKKRAQSAPPAPAQHQQAAPAPATAPPEQKTTPAAEADHYDGV